MIIEKTTISKNDYKKFNNDILKMKFFLILVLTLFFFVFEKIKIVTRKKFESEVRRKT